MALRLRRGSDAQRLTITPADGELIYETTNKRLFVGDGVTVGGNGVSAPVTSVNAKTGAVTLTSDDIPEGTNKFYYTDNKALDAVGAMFENGTHSNISFVYDETLNTISATSAGAYTDNNALDAVGAALVASNGSNTGITFSYTAETNTITAAVAASGSGTVNTGTAGSLGVYLTNGTTLSPSTALQWNNTTGRLSILDGYLAVTSDTTGEVQVNFDTFFTGAAANSLSLRRARGSRATPASVAISDIIHSIDFTAYDGATFKVAGSITTAVSQTPSTGIVPGIMTFGVADTAGVVQPRVRIAETGRMFVGPFLNADGGSGALTIRQTLSSGGSNYPLIIRNTFNDANGPSFSLGKWRGTNSSPLIVQTGDVTAQIDAFGHDGVTARLSSQILMNVNSSPSAGKVPGAISLNVAHANGTLTNVVKVYNSGTTTTSGTMEVTGTVSATSYATTGLGPSAVTSTIALELSSPIAVTVTGGGTFRLPLLDATARTALSAVNGDMIYNTTENKVQAYQNGFWINLDGTV
jgi:hypothetical protein